jgi:hypothetical protein
LEHIKGVDALRVWCDQGFDIKGWVVKVQPLTIKVLVVAIEDVVIKVCSIKAW